MIHMIADSPMSYLPDLRHHLRCHARIPFGVYLRRHEGLVAQDGAGVFRAELLANPGRRGVSELVGVPAVDLRPFTAPDNRSVVGHTGVMILGLPAGPARVWFFRNAPM